MKSFRLGRPVLSLLRALVLYRSIKKVDFSFGWFSLFVGLQVGTLFTVGYFVLAAFFPHLLAVQLGADWWWYVVCFCAARLSVAFFEFFFHRYVLHSVFWRLLRGLAKKHRKHHGLTHVVELKEPTHIVELRSEPIEPGRVRIRNRFPIVEPSQIESSAFPAWALAAFWGIFTPLILTVQLLSPNLPWLVCCYLAVPWSLWLYETIHAIEHLDYDKVWRPLIERPGLIGRLIRKAYGFHLMHHANDSVNLAISGFLALPVPDWVFGTFFVPRELPLPNTEVDPKTQIPPKPLFVIRWLDLLVDSCERRMKDADRLRIQQQING